MGRESRIYEGNLEQSDFRYLILDKKSLPAVSPALYTFWPVLRTHSTRIYSVRLTMKDHPFMEFYSEGAFEDAPPFDFLYYDFWNGDFIDDGHFNESLLA